MNNLNLTGISAFNWEKDKTPRNKYSAPYQVSQDRNVNSGNLNLDSQTGICEMDNELNENIPLNIGLFGFGCVGKGLYDVLNHSQGLNAMISKICVKDRSKKRPISIDNFTFEKYDVLANNEHDVIVELIDDSDAALEIITDSLSKGRNVVTAGKKVVAENFHLFYQLQQQTGASLLYEAACAGSIPIIRTLEEYYDNELLSSVKGILNGSSNYILTKMELDKLSYIEALKQAQNAGFAESDPLLDVNGEDAKYKLCLIAAHAFGIILQPENIFNYGIQNITEFDINYAAQNNLRIKLIAEIRKSSNGYRAYVLPRFVPLNKPLANINYEFNGIEVEGIYSDKQLFTGKGAGSHPTGSAVLSDISAITYNYRYGYKKLKKNKNLNRLLNSVFVINSNLESNFNLRLFIRYNKSGELDQLNILNIEEDFRSARGNYIIADVGFESLIKLNDAGNKLFAGEI
ncbi:MAG: homoserine dehydrogenase [Ignavibacteria bacterium]|nr:homoserine dehydrogenase [Ignavibacteria bacterium]